MNTSNQDRRPLPAPGPSLAGRLRRALPAALSGAIAVALLLGACSMPPRLKSALFEPTPPPKPVVHQMRHPPYKAPEPPPVVLRRAEQPRRDWAADLAKLPQTEVGGTDWVRALNDGLIKPKPGIEDTAEEEPELDLNVELVPSDSPDMKATYPHKIHTRLFACANCHTGIFQMQAGADPITMEKILGGEYCGRCHGKVAFDPVTACPRCHLSMAAQ
jgi:c(7)-type cytochrome triheme protein